MLVEPRKFNDDWMLGRDGDVQVDGFFMEGTDLERERCSLQYEINPPRLALHQRLGSCMVGIRVEWGC